MLRETFLIHVCVAEVERKVHSAVISIFHQSTDDKDGSLNRRPVLCVILLDDDQSKCADC